jgi:hypothetical protein
MCGARPSKDHEKISVKLYYIILLSLSIHFNKITTIAGTD